MVDNNLIERVSGALLSMQRYNWEQGVASQAYLESGDRDMTILFAKEAVLRQSEDGRLGMIGGGSAVTDPAANGEAVLYAADITGDDALKEAADRMLDYLMNKAPRNKDGILYHLTRNRQVWVDSFYMAPPFLAAAGMYHEAVLQIKGFRSLLWNKEKKLYSHIWDDEKQCFEREAFWSVGNGWAAAGITRVCKALPITMNQEKAELSEYIKETLDSCLKYMREDGLFFDIMDDENSFVETNASQMFAYSIYSGIKGGWLGKEYRKYADRMRMAVHGKVDEFGLVQGVCGAPRFKSPGTAVEGQAFFLLMEAAVKALR